MKLKISLVILAGILLFSCSKEIKEQKPEETKVESSAKIEPKENEFLSKPEYSAPEKTAEQIELEEKYKKSEAYEESLKQLRTELDKKESAIIAQIPVAATDADLEQKRAITGLYDHKKKVYNYTNFEEVIKEGDSYHCKQKVKTQNGRILDYNLQIKKPKFRKYYAVSGIELMSSIDIGNIDKKIIEQQLHEEIYDLKTDEKKDEMIKLFEDYENTQYPLFKEVVHTDWDTGVKTKGYKQYDMKILDYVKGNFTNSGYDEYFVMFYEDDPDPEIYDQFIERVRCFVVSEGKIISDYYISNSGGFFYPGLSNDKLSEVEAFGFKFSQGWIADFNQNGINEIYLAAFFNIEGGGLLMVEYNDGSFVTGYVYGDRYDIVSVDWYKKIIIIKDKSGNGEWIDDYQWNDTLKEFILYKEQILGGLRNEKNY